MRSGIEWLAHLWGRRGRQVSQAYHAQFGADHGTARAVLADLAHLCHAAGDTFVPGDSHLTAYRQGQRSVWLHLQHMLDIPPERVPEILNEVNDD